MVLSSIGILKAQRKRGEKKTLIFYLSKNIWKSVFILRKKNQNFFFFWKSEFHLGRHFDYIKETRTCKSAKTQRLVIIKRLVVSISLSHFPFWKKSHFFLTLSQITQPIFKTRKFPLKKLVFLTTKTDRLNSRNGRVQIFSPKNLILSLQKGF